MIVTKVMATKVRSLRDKLRPSTLHPKLALTMNSNKVKLVVQ